MQTARMLGNYVDYLAASKGMSLSEIATILDCSEHRAYSFIKGRSHPSFSQISALATQLDSSVTELLKGDENVYRQTVVQCMNGFDKEDHREEILDIIDSYIDLCDAISDTQ